LAEQLEFFFETSRKKLVKRLMISQIIMEEIGLLMISQIITEEIGLKADDFTDHHGRDWSKG